MFQAAIRRGVGQLRGWRVDLRALRLQRAVPLRPVLLPGYRRVLVGQLQACLEPLAHPLMAHLDRLGYHQRGVIDHDTSSLESRAPMDRKSHTGYIACVRSSRWSRHAAARAYHAQAAV